MGAVSIAAIMTLALFVTSCSIKDDPHGKETTTTAKHTGEQETVATSPTDTSAETVAESEELTEEATEAHVHAFGEWSVTTAATCTEKGNKRAKLKRRYLYSPQKIARQEQHNHLANKALAFGDEFFIEKMSYKGLAKRTKEDKVTETGKHRSKKRFGKSVANKAPAAFVDTIKQKVFAQGGTFSEINTFTAKATQYNPIEDTYSKKSLSKRWDYVGDNKLQRDLFSAFKIQHIHDDLQTIDRDACIRDFPNFVKLHEKEIRRLMNSPVHKPSSMGV